MINRLIDKTIDVVLTLTRVILLVILILIIVYNNRYTLYIFNGWHTTLNDTNTSYMLIGLIISIITILLYSLINLSEKYSRLFLWTVIILSFIFRIIIALSIRVEPAGDAYFLYESVNAFINGNPVGFLKGGYISTHMNQLGGATVFFPLVYMIKDSFNYYVIVNAFFIHGSIYVFSKFVEETFSLKKSLFVTLLLLSFVPNWFMQFLIYSDSVGIFLLSLTIYFGNKVMKSDAFIGPFLIALTISVLVRQNLYVVLIAFIIVFVMFVHNYKLKMKLVIALAFIVVFSSNVLTTAYNHILDLELGENSIPFKTNFAMGLGEVGYTNRFVNYLAENNYDSNSLSVYVDDFLNNRLIELSQPSISIPFFERKFIYSWTDQDFDSLSFIFPFDFEVSLQDFTNDNSIRFGRGGSGTTSLNPIGDFLYLNLFNLRSVEKVLLFAYVFLAIFGLAINFKSRSYKQFTLELFIVGTTLAFLISETQPRYLWMTMNVIIVFAGLTLDESKLFDYLDFLKSIKSFFIRRSV